MLYLSHYGIKGMKWGVRHDRKTGDINIKKGTHFGRLTVYDESSAKGHAYVNYRKDDIKKYRGFFGANLRRIHKGKDVKELDLIAKTNMKAPSRKVREKTFIEIHKKDPLISKELAKYHKSDWHYFTPLPTSFYAKYYSNLKNDKRYQKAYTTFVRSIGANVYIRDKYFKSLSKKGYNFVTDDLDAGKFGKEPAIIFDRNKSLKYNGERIVSKKEIKDTWKKYGTFEKKRGDIIKMNDIEWLSHARGWFAPPLGTHVSKLKDSGKSISSKVKSKSIKGYKKEEKKKTKKKKDKPMSPLEKKTSRIKEEISYLESKKKLENLKNPKKKSPYTDKTSDINEETKYLEAKKKLENLKNPNKNYEGAASSFKTVGSTISEVSNGIGKAWNHLHNAKYSDVDRSKEVQNLSNAELRNAIERIKLDQEYNRITTPQKSKGYDYTMAALSGLETVAKVTSAGLSIASGIQKIKSN